MFNTNSVSKEKEKLYKKRTTSGNNNINNRTFMSNQTNQITNTTKINRNNHLNQNNKIKKNNIIIGIGPVNFGNVIRKNISRDKKQKISTITTNHTIHNTKLKFGKVMTSTNNSKEKNIPSSIKSSSSSKQKNGNDNFIKNKVPRKNLSIKI